jgi:tRNA threonylcarbamoyl adenosine modification protein YeaZ
VSERRLLLALDTATRHPTLALVERDDEVVGESQWESQHRHGEELLQRLDTLLANAGVRPRDLSGVIVGIGPGSFTGLRIGLATAKTMAYSLDVPIVGVSTTQALALAALDGESGRTEFAVSLPAGATDRYVHRVVVDGDTVTEQAPPQLVVPGSAFDAACSDALIVAVDLDGAEDISDEDAQRGETALAGLARALAMLGTQALKAGRQDDIERLVPAYVALPRGIARAVAEMTWSPDLR